MYQSPISTFIPKYLNFFPCKYEKFFYYINENEAKKKRNSFHIFTFDNLINRYTHTDIQNQFRNTTSPNIYKSKCIYNNNNQSINT